jgi:hypothetical protein
MEFLQNLRNKLRGLWFVLVREYRAANSYCFRCGKRGAHIASLVFPKRLCDLCATVVCRRYDSGFNKKNES